MSNDRKKLLDINELPEATDNDNLVVGRGNSFRRFSFINFKNYILSQVSNTIAQLQTYVDDALTTINNRFTQIESSITNINSIITDILSDISSIKDSINNIINFLTTVSLLNTCREIQYTNLGQVSSLSIDLDITNKWNIFELTGTNTTLTISGVNPDTGLLEPSNFTILNTSGITKTIILNTTVFNNINSLVNSIILPNGYKVILNIRKNPFNQTQLYEVTIGDISFNQTDSLNDTIWNINDKSALIDLTNNGTLIQNISSSNNTGRQLGTIRAFGGKSSGKWRFAVKVITPPSGHSSGNAYMYIGISDLSPALNTAVGYSPESYSFYNGFTGTSTVAYGRANNSAFLTLTPPAARALIINDIIEVLVDLDTNKLWFVINNIVLGGGNPETGTGAAYFLNPSPLYYPAMSLWEERNVNGVSVNAGVYQLIKESENPYVNSRPSFKHWKI